jgi:teichuronic acid biosynthesis glycosyltransferase TuaH
MTRMKTIICHSFPEWDTPYVKSTVELMTRLAGQNRVIFIDYHYTAKDLLSHPNAPKNQLLGKVSRWRKIQTEHGQIQVYNTMPVLPVNWINNQLLFNLIMIINAWLVGFSIKKILKSVDKENTTLVNAFNPIYGWFTKKYWKGIPSTYYSYDEIDLTECAAKWGTIYETKYAQQVNEIITSSSHLKKKFDKIHNKVACVKNGVNLSIFKQEKIETTRNHVLGYVGVIDHRIDLNLLKDLAQALPGFKIEMLGPLKVEISNDMPSNVVFLGALPQLEIPDIANKWDVCIIPFVKNQLTIAIYPLKINEYLAMGKPVVTTDFSDLSDFEQLISITNTYKDFITATKKEFRYNNRIKIQKRIEFSLQNSWESRAESFGLALA